MMTYTIHVPATFAFDVQAESEEEALRIANEKIQGEEPMDDDTARLAYRYQAPWVSLDRESTPKVVDWF